jgi:hypothetical protein
LAWSFDTALRRAAVAFAAAFAVLALSAPHASAFSVSYCYTTLSPGYYCGHGNYNSIIYNRSTGINYAGNNCVFMITAAGNLRGSGAVPCDSDYNYDARMCVSRATPMSEGRTFVQYYSDYLAAVVNNTTYDSGCAV